jgi:hypothetical protein
MKSLVLISVVLLSGCATTGGGSFFDPEVSAGNARFVSIYDPIGIPGKGMQMADSHCSNHGRTAVPRGRGGEGTQCAVSPEYCTTYECVE